MSDCILAIKANHKTLWLTDPVANSVMEQQRKHSLVDIGKKAVIMTLIKINDSAEDIRPGKEEMKKLHGGNLGGFRPWFIIPLARIFHESVSN